jgi:thioredoxin reductase (NADPH)
MRTRLDLKGFIITSENLQTTVSGIFSAGDCRRDSINQIVSAAGEGVAAAIYIRELLRNH